MLTKVLVANRGEIACRIMRTLRAMGIDSVAVYPHEDRRAPHVSLADEAHVIEGRTPTAAYLNQHEIIDACRATGADAIHPGYGFLSENAAFAEAATEAGLVFIGPASQTIRLMGDKIQARAFAAKNGLPITPSATWENGAETIDAFCKRASEIGFPLLIKAAAGGGGKGMRVARSTSELREYALTCISEAERYFGDERIYAEKLIAEPRHIEVQIFGDGTGDVVHLYERECSLQRRYQKIVEEAPAPNLPKELRDEICSAAVELAAAARYRNAGTIEFILGADNLFYFLEMNTRLQVEHPVTELVLGLDLVAEQVRVAAGEGLSFTQDDLMPRGHAIECRLCAEVPEKDFVPAAGRVGILRVPPRPNVRADLGIVEGQVITPAFDPMLGKLIAFGDTREEAITNMEASLRELVLLGIPTNIDYLARIMRNPAFRRGDLNTGFLADEAGSLAPSPALDAELATAVIAALLAKNDFRRLAFGVPEPYASIGDWRN
jgi:propionyl-CoA carboxylase alpha chain/3-methylcrotonyl-CoA carboxylase alpha subunit/acetyl-CoA/propionyl-CoA carboxylase biotin carboxyl carrier protein